MTSNMKDNVTVIIEWTEFEIRRGEVTLSREKLRQMIDEGDSSSLISAAVAQARTNVIHEGVDDTASVFVHPNGCYDEESVEI